MGLLYAYPPPRMPNWIWNSLGNDLWPVTRGSYGSQVSVLHSPHMPNAILKWSGAKYQCPFHHHSLPYLRAMCATTLSCGTIIALDCSNS